MTHAVTLDPGCIAFPALCVPRDVGVYLVRDVREMRTTRAQLFWRYRHFDGLRIFDAEGQAYVVQTACVSKPRTRIGRFLARLLDLAITADLTVAPIRAASLAEVASAVQRAIEADAESFEELSGRSVEWWRATLGQAVSVQGVIGAFGAAQQRV